MLPFCRNNGVTAVQGGSAICCPLVRTGFFRLLPWIMLLFLWMNPAFASTDIELENLFINQTRTRGGNEFFQRFSSLWEDIPGQKTTYTVIVKEAPSVRFGSTVTVELNDTVVYRGILRTRSSDVADAAMQAVQNARLVLLQLEQQQLNGNKFESQEEM